MELSDVLAFVALLFSALALHYSHFRKITKLSGRIIKLKYSGFQLSEIHFLFSNSGNQDLVVNMYTLLSTGEKKPMFYDSLETALIIKSGSFEEYRLKGKWLSDLQDGSPQNPSI